MTGLWNVRAGFKPARFSQIFARHVHGLPCNKVDPVNFWYVDTKKHAPYQYPQPKGITIPGKVWDSDNGSWVDEE